MSVKFGARIYMSKTTTKTPKFQVSPRLARLPMYVFAELDVFKEEALAKEIESVNNKVEAQTKILKHIINKIAK